MKSISRLFKSLLAASMLLALEGCKSTDGGTSSVSGGMYEDPYFDAWYYGDYYNDWDIVVTPPDRPTDPPKPTHPIVLPPDAPTPTPPIATPPPRPAPMPSIPRMPMPRVRVR